jgi:hypothetical protein
MPDPAAPNPKPGRRGDPNFLEVVAISAGVLLLFFIGACLVLMHSGKNLLPNAHPDHEPHSCVVMPGAGTGAALV